MKIAATGHRPHKLGGYGERAYDALLSFAWLYLRQQSADLHVISGMALGWDTAFADAAWRLGMPFTAAIPFEGQQARWPEQSRRKYAELLSRATRVVMVCPPGYDPAKMQRRNEWMVDNSDGVVALWNGTSGGTANCVRYAETKGRPVVNLWPLWQR